MRVGVCAAARFSAFRHNSAATRRRLSMVSETPSIMDTQEQEELMAIGSDEQTGLAIEASIAMQPVRAALEHKQACLSFGCCYLSTLLVRVLLLLLFVVLFVFLFFVWGVGRKAMPPVRAPAFQQHEQRELQQRHRGTREQARVPIPAMLTPPVGSQTPPPPALIPATSPEPLEALNSQADPPLPGEHVFKDSSTPRKGRLLCALKQRLSPLPGMPPIRRHSSEPVPPPETGPHTPAARSGSLRALDPAPPPSPAPAQPRTWKGPAHNGGGAKLGKTSTAERLAAYKTCLDRCEAFDPQHMRGNRALRIDSERCRANTCGA